MGVLALSAGAAAAAKPPTGRLSALATVDAWHVDGGALKRGGLLIVAVGQVGVEVDGERLLGARGLTASAVAVFSNRRSVSNERVGDLHGVDNREAPKRATLFEAWVRQALPDGYLKAGLFDLNSEFSVNRAGAVFINGATGLGLDVAQLGWGGPSIYPQARPGAIVAREGRTAWKAALFSGERASDRPGSSPPSLAVAEASRQGTGWRVTLGAWRHSRHYGGGYEHLAPHAGKGGYGLVERDLLTRGGRLLEGFARLGLADGEADALRSDLNAGLVLHRPLMGHDGEAAGVAVLRSTFSKAALRLPRDERLSRHETALEATYRMPLAGGVAVQPDIQYVLHPGGLASRREALVIGVRLEGNWARQF